MSACWPFRLSWPCSWRRAADICFKMHVMYILMRRRTQRNTVDADSGLCTRLSGYTLRVLMCCATHRDRQITIAELADHHGASEARLGLACGSCCCKSKRARHCCWPARTSKRSSPCMSSTWPVKRANACRSPPGCWVTTGTSDHGHGDNHPQRTIRPTGVQRRPGTLPRNGSKRCETARITGVTPPPKATRDTVESQPAQPQARQVTSRPDRRRAGCWPTRSAAQAGDRLACCPRPANRCARSGRLTRQRPAPAPPQRLPRRGGESPAGQMHWFCIFWLRLAPTLRHGRQPGSRRAMGWRRASPRWRGGGRHDDPVAIPASPRWPRGAAGRAWGG